MFGMISGMFRSKSTTPNPAMTPMSPIMVSDYIETASLTPELRDINKKIITNDLLNLFNNNVTSKHLLYLDGIIGKNDGTFPVSNPEKDNVYFYAVERKYYKCNKSVSGVVNAPDTNFSEFSLFNFKGGVSGITITGAATGSGQLDEATGMMTVNTSVEYSKITGTPKSLPNPNSLTIKLNGNSGTAYSGSSVVELNITAESIGAQKAGNYASADHNHDSVYAPIKHSHSEYALTSHTHTANQIGAMTGYVKASEGGAISVSDTLLAAIGKLEKGLDSKQAAGSYAASNHNHNGVYQPAGSYATATHNHDGTYAKASHGNHVPATQTANNKIFLRCDNTWATITPANIGAQPAGSYATANHTHTGYAASNHTHTGYLSTSGGTVSGALTVTGQILSNADVVAYSDARMTTNVVKIDSALDKVSAINGYTYDMQGVEFGGQRQAGVIAQELKEVLPEAVVTDDNGYYAVRYTNIIPLLIEALKEEKSKRENLEERLAKIERMLDIK